MSSIGIQVGVSPEGAKATAEGIVAILGAEVEQKTLRRALKTYEKATSVNHALVSHNLITLAKDEDEDEQAG